MNSTDQNILNCLLASLNQGEKPWLVTVVATIGSSPRPVGSLVAFRADGSQVGSVSGGCVEEDLIARLLAGEFDGPQVYLTDYGVSAEDKEKWGSFDYSQQEPRLVVHYANKVGLEGSQKLLQAYQNNKAPYVKIKSTNIKALEKIDLDSLKEFALDIS